MYPRTTDMEEMARRCFPDTLGFYRYWDSKRLGADGSRRRMPRRQDIDPLEMKRWLPHLQLIDVVPDTAAAHGRRLVYRLVGDTEIELRGYNPTGRTVDECAIGKETSDAMGNYNLVIDGRMPVYDWSKIAHPRGFLISQECVLLPLSENDDTVTHVITYGKVISSLDQPPPMRDIL